MRGEAERPDRRRVEPLAVDLGLRDDSVDIAGGHFRILSECGAANDGRRAVSAEEEKQEAAAGDGEGSRFIHEERAHRLAKLDAMRERGDRALPGPLRPRPHRRRAPRALRRPRPGRRLRRARQHRRAGRRPAPPRRPRLHRPARRDREDPADRDPRRARRGVSSTSSTRSTSATGSAPTGIVVTQPARRALGPDRELRAALQGAAAAARHAPRPHRPGGPLPAPLPRPDRRRGLARGLREALDRDRGDPAGAARPRLPRGRDAGPALARPAAPQRGRSSPTTTRSTSTCSCGSPSSCR